ncbi:MAG: formimidoylglutamase [Bacteroidales bacterium]|nr:formimidoylglutamase [Bacteroidales bacterium]
MSSFKLQDFCTPFNKDSVNLPLIHNKNDLLFSRILFYVDNAESDYLKISDIAIIGVPEERNSDNKGCSAAPDKIREELYKLYAPSQLKITDLGNLKNGKNVNDTYFALTEVVFECFKNETAVIIIGGSNDLIAPVCTAYAKGKKQFNLCVIDSVFNLDDNPELISSQNYLSYILNKNKNIFSYTNIGYQTYYNSPQEINFIKSNFEAVRLGIARTDLFGNEPFIRDADFVCVNGRSIKMTDAPAAVKPSVHGFYGEEICQLAKYAGISDNVSAFGLFDINPKYDNRNQTSALGAQIIWHFLESFYQRKGENDKNIIKKYKKYIVNITDVSENLIFYKSQKTDRWWVEVPYHIKDKEKVYLLSCTKDDYIKAGNNEIPERWWKFFQKLN